MAPSPSDSRADSRRDLPTGPVDAVSIALRFAGPDLDPADITALLQLPPSIAIQAGDVVRSRVARTGQWIWEGPRIPEVDLETRIQELLTRLPVAPSCWDALRPFNGDLFCGLWLGSWNRGLDLSPALAQALADRHLRLSLDIYFEGADDADDDLDDPIPAG